MPPGFKADFLLDPDIVFLNHGSFGACPRPVFEEYQRLQRELERNPVAFLGWRCHEMMADARAQLGDSWARRPTTWCSSQTPPRPPI